MEFPAYCYQLFVTVCIRIDCRQCLGMDLFPIFTVKPFCHEMIISIYLIEFGWHHIDSSHSSQFIVSHFQLC